MHVYAEVEKPFIAMFYVPVLAMLPQNTLKCNFSVLLLWLLWLLYELLLVIVVLIV